MPLQLGKSFDRSYALRIPFLTGYIDITIFFCKKSTFLLFNVDKKEKDNIDVGVKINMFKNLESSQFCETFLELHNYRKNTLDILNQYKCIRPEYSSEISFLSNETLTLSKIDIENENGEKKSVFDNLNVYVFTINSLINEFVFLLAERHHISTKINKKIVRTSGVQIATSHALQILNEFHEDSMKGKLAFENRVPTDDKIVLD